MERSVKQSHVLSGGSTPTTTIAGVELSSPDKILFPTQGLTKRALVRYWQAVSGFAVPLLAGRPLTLVRCPRGTGERCFFQKHLPPSMSPLVGRVSVRAEQDPYGYIKDLSSIIALVQLGTVELHVWGCLFDQLEKPDVVVIDLDPGEQAPWSSVVSAAHEVKEILERVGLVPFLRATGGRGVHVVVPLQRGPSWAQTKAFAHDVASLLARNRPEEYTDRSLKTERVGRIYVDYLRNDREATSVGSYSVRATAGAPVALPIAWEDLSKKTRPIYSVECALGLVRSRPDPWQTFEQSRRPLPRTRLLTGGRSPVSRP